MHLRHLQLNGPRLDAHKVGKPLSLPLELHRAEHDQIGRELADYSDHSFDPPQAVRPLRHVGVDDEVDQRVGALT